MLTTEQSMKVIDAFRSGDYRQHAFPGSPLTYVDDAGTCSYCAQGLVDELLGERISNSTNIQLDAFSFCMALSDLNCVSFKNIADYLEMTLLMDIDPELAFLRIASLYANTAQTEPNYYDLKYVLYGKEGVLKRRAVAFDVTKTPQQLVGAAS